MHKYFWKGFDWDHKAFLCLPTTPNPVCCYLLLLHLSLLFALHVSFLSFLSSDSGSCGPKRLAFATSAAGTAVAALEAAGFLVVPTWVWTSSGWKSWHPPPHLHFLLLALRRTWVMASLCYSLGSGLLPRRHPKWTVWICKIHSIMFYFITKTVTKLPIEATCE